jgi:tRNA-splicing ligase RtcB (3'-phosphate/5'-hydroxy nucleic acid ligase)
MRGRVGQKLRNKNPKPPLRDREFAMSLKESLSEVRKDVWELPAAAKKGMNVPVKLYLSKQLLSEVDEGAIDQAANVAFLPGIHRNSIALPDMHFGYGFPIGGVAALDFEKGGLSPGGIGFDINCGVRLLRSNFSTDQIMPKLPKLLDSVFSNVPSGVGSKGKVRLTVQQLKEVCERGAQWAVENGYGNDRDISHIEERGAMKGADASKVSDKAMQRGMPQLGSLGAGNHFLEIQKVEKIFLPDVAKAFGLDRGEGQVTFMIHSGSRGLGHQVCTDYLQILERAFRKEMSTLPDRELVYAPAGTKECDDYFGAMACGANFAWTNRQMMMHWVRESIYKTLGASESDAGVDLVYDVAHNIGKIEEHEIDGKKTKVYIHRKGATRAFPAGHPEIPADYRKFGQPVLIPGSMGTASYVLVGTETSKETFYSTAHGAGRSSSRSKMLRDVRGEDVAKALTAKGILSKAQSWQVLAEEAPEAYKDVDEVVRVCEEAGIARIVAKLKPIAVAKG